MTIYGSRIIADTAGIAVKDSGLNRSATPVSVAGNRWCYVL
jgi:hypothetical protein